MKRCSEEINPGAALVRATDTGWRLLRLVLLLAICCQLLVACGQEEKPSATAEKDRYSLSYQAGPHGRIEGAAEQQVAAGASGETVTAVAEEGYRFQAWSDGLQRAERTEKQVTADLQVTARFVRQRFPLTYTAAEHGRIEGETVQTVALGEDATEVTAVAEPGYRFYRWSDGVQTASRIDRKLSGALTVTARFVPGQVTLEYLAGTHGRISGQARQSLEPHGDGTPVVAVPDENYQFAGWSDGLASAERVDRNVASNLRVTARFAKEIYRLNYLAAANGRIDGPAQQRVASGGSGQQVTAVAAPGYHFVRWSDGLTTASRTDREVSESLEVTADFAVNRYTLRYRAGEHGAVKGNLEQEVEQGADGSPVEAVAAKNYRFVRWSDGVTSARRTDRKVSRSLQVRAEFELEAYSVGGSVSGLAAGSQLKLQLNGRTTLTIRENGPFRFAEEIARGAAYQVEVAAQPSSPNQDCVVNGGRGSVAGAAVDSIEIACTTVGYRIGGTLLGLPEGERVVLQNSDGDELVLKANGPFQFPLSLEDGSSYQVTVAEHPARRNWTCDVANASGVLAGASVVDLQVSCYQKLVLEATPGRRSAELRWNESDFKQVTFNLCAAQEEISEGLFARCRELAAGVQVDGVKDGYLLQGLQNDQRYWVQLQANYADGRTTVSDPVQVTPYGGLNDTGIDWCADQARNFNPTSPRSKKQQSCKQQAKRFPGQDGLQGRDAKARVRELDKQGSGSAGFDFSKICRSGEAAGEQKCPPNPRPGNGFDEWACTQDNVTGLTWEIKTDAGLRSKYHNYFWMLPVAGLSSGQENEAACEKGVCDLQAYVDKVNRDGLCGYSDWRLPTRRELLSIVDNGQINPAIDTRYFPNAMADYYWTSSAYQDQPGLAWQVYFFYGESKPGEKKLARPVRLVRGKTVTFGMDNP